MNPKVAVPLLLSLGLGFGLGCIPLVNEHLHWNIWFVVPVSGLLVGLTLAWVQFQSSYVLDLSISGRSLALLALTAMAGYGLTDYGVYLTSSIALKDASGIPDGQYPLRALISFSDYMSWRLSGSSVSSLRSRGVVFHMGAPGTTVTYVADLLGALLGAAGTLLTLKEKYPFCSRCDRYKKRDRVYEVVFEYDEALAKEVFGKIAEVSDKQSYEELVSCLRDLSERYRSSRGNVKIRADQRYCPTCREATVVGNVYRLDRRKEWKEVDDLKWTFTSQPGQHVQMGA